MNDTLLLGTNGRPTSSLSQPHIGYWTEYDCFLAFGENARLAFVSALQQSRSALSLKARREKKPRATKAKSSPSKKPKAIISSGLASKIPPEILAKMSQDVRASLGL